MIVIAFKHTALDECQALTAEDVLVHANPFNGVSHGTEAREYYLDGYGSPSGGLTPITFGEIVSIMPQHKRIEML